MSILGKVYGLSDLQLAKSKGEVKNKLRKKLTNVFIPTTPNPTSGFLLMVPNNELRKLNVSVDDAIKTIVSAGIIKLEPKQKKILKIFIPVKNIF